MSNAVNVCDLWNLELEFPAKAPKKTLRSWDNIRVFTKKDAKATVETKHLQYSESSHFLPLYNERMNARNEGVWHREIRYCSGLSDRMHKRRASEKCCHRNQQRKPRLVQSSIEWQIAKEEEEEENWDERGWFMWFSILFSRMLVVPLWSAEKRFPGTRTGGGVIEFWFGLKGLGCGELCMIWFWRWENVCICERVYWVGRARGFIMAGREVKEYTNLSNARGMWRVALFGASTLFACTFWTRAEFLAFINPSVLSCIIFSFYLICRRNKWTIGFVQLISRVSLIVSCGKLASHDTSSIVRDLFEKASERGSDWSNSNHIFIILWESDCGRYCGQSVPLVP